MVKKRIGILTGGGDVPGVPSRVVLEFGDAISGISRVSGQAARSIG
jgi:6-phosphofructokinase